MGKIAVLPPAVQGQIAAGEVVFLRRVVPGGADRSYGIHVARLAGLPASVTRRAEAILRQLEGARAANHDDLLAELLSLDPGTLSPIEALNWLWKIHGRYAK